MIDAVFASEDDTVDLLGFHSGCLVAAEIALRLPQRIRHLVLIDAPYFDRDTQEKFYGQVATPLALTRDVACLGKAWDFNVASREEIVPLDRALQMFADQLTSGVQDYYCFHAAFTYDCIGRFSQLAVPTTVIATQSPLTAATLAAAEAIDSAELIQEPEIKTSVFEQGAEAIAAHVRRVLEQCLRLELLKLGHVLCLVYWLGADLGVFYSSYFVADDKLKAETRVAMAKLLFALDQGPRICMPLIFAFGAHLAFRLGLWQIPGIASWQRFGWCASGGLRWS